MGDARDLGRGPFIGRVDVETLTSSGDVDTTVEEYRH